MSQTSTPPDNEQEFEEKLAYLLRPNLVEKNPGIRQKQILKGVRWLATFQELFKLYLYFLPKALFDLLQHLVKTPDKKD